MIILDNPNAWFYDGVHFKIMVTRPVDHVGDCCLVGWILPRIKILAKKKNISAFEGEKRQQSQYFVHCMSSIKKIHCGWKCCHSMIRFLSTKPSHLPGSRLSRGLSGGTCVSLCSGWEAWWFPPPGRASSLCWRRFPTDPDCTLQTHCLAASEPSSHTHSSPPLLQGAAHAGQVTCRATEWVRRVSLNFNMQTSSQVPNTAILTTQQMCSENKGC